MSQASRGVFVGLATFDVVHHVRHRPGPNQKVTARSQSAGAGGPATNAALTFAALGAQATLITSLGTGPIASVVRHDLAGHGVQVVDATPSDAAGPPISAATVLTSSGERSVVSVDAVDVVTPVPAGLAGLVRSADVILVDGHYPVLALAAVRAAMDGGVRVVVDAGRWKPVMPVLISLATGPGSTVELVLSADFCLPGQPSAAATVDALAAAGAPVVVMTHGGDPVVWAQDGRSGTVGVPAVDVVDTLGAGDVFHGAYAFYSGQLGLDLPARIALSIGAASARCEVSGPQEWAAVLTRWAAPTA